MPKKFVVEPCGRADVKDFIEANHYSKSINGCKSEYCFRLLDGDTIVGAAFFGCMAMANQWKRFGEKESDVIELRRLCCIDETPKNTESYFIGKMIRWLKRNTNIKTIVSYADQEHGHTGTIYRAANFNYLGHRPGSKSILFNGKVYHDKTIRTKYKGELKPYAKKIVEALERGEAVYKKTAGKHTYTYKLRD